MPRCRLRQELKRLRRMGAKGVTGGRCGEMSSHLQRHVGLEHLLHISL